MNLCIEHQGWKDHLEMLVIFNIFKHPHHIRANVNVEPYEEWEGDIFVCFCGLDGYKLHDCYKKKVVWALHTCQHGEITKFQVARLKFDHVVELTFIMC